MGIFSKGKLLGVSKTIRALIPLGLEEERSVYIPKWFNCMHLVFLVNQHL